MLSPWSRPHSAASHNFTVRFAEGERCDQKNYRHRGAGLPLRSEQPRGIRSRICSHQHSPIVRAGQGKTLQDERGLFSGAHFPLLRCGRIPQLRKHNDALRRRRCRHYAAHFARPRRAQTPRSYDASELIVHTGLAAAAISAPRWERHERAALAKDRQILAQRLIH